MKELWQRGEDISLKDGIYLAVIEVSGILSSVFQLTGEDTRTVTRLVGLCGFCVWQGMRWSMRRRTNDIEVG